MLWKHQEASSCFIVPHVQGNGTWQSRQACFFKENAPTFCHKFYAQTDEFTVGVQMANSQALTLHCHDDHTIWMKEYQHLDWCRSRHVLKRRRAFLICFQYQLKVSYTVHKPYTHTALSLRREKKYCPIRGPLLAFRWTTKQACKICFICSIPVSPRKSYLLVKHIAFFNQCSK